MAWLHTMGVAKLFSTESLTFVISPISDISNLKYKVTYWNRAIRLGLFKIEIETGWVLVLDRDNHLDNPLVPWNAKYRYPVGINMVEFVSGYLSRDELILAVTQTLNRKINNGPNIKNINYNKLRLRDF